MSFNVDHPVDHQCAFTSSKAVDSDVDSLVDRPCAFISSEAVSEGLDGYFVYELRGEATPNSTSGRPRTLPVPRPSLCARKIRGAVNAH